MGRADPHGAVLAALGEQGAGVPNRADKSLIIDAKGVVAWGGAFL